MKWAVIVVLVAAVSWAKIPSKASDERIVGGQIAELHSIPHQVAMIIQRNQSAPNLCGGSIINDKTILTAAHCLYNADKALVIMGATDLTSNNTEIIKQLVSRSNFKIYPNFNHYLANLDIALVFLTETVTFSKAIQPVKLPSGYLFDESFSGEIGTVSGFGQICDTNCGATHLLRFTENRIMTNDDCSLSFGFNAIPSETQVCTQTADTKSGTCRGDSGGPLTILRHNKTLQVGLTSFGFRKCEDGKPTVFTRLTKDLLSWIRDEVEDRFEMKSATEIF